MEKEFVNYNQALKLKQLGFDEPCFAFYLAGGIRFKQYKDSQNRNSSFFNKTVCSVPTFSQAFRWFREKYGLYSWITMELGNKSTFCWVLSDEHTSTQYAAYFKTYEEAELACLDKLIEIVESK